MKAKISWRIAMTAGVMVVSIVSAIGAQGVVWPRRVDVALTVVDVEGRAVPQFEAMLHSHQEGYLRWQPGKEGSIHFGSGGANTLTLQNDPQIQVIVRAPDLAPALLHLEYTMPVKEAVTLTPGRLIDLFVRTADGRSIPPEVTPLVIYRDFASRVRIYRMPQNQRPGDIVDFEMSKVRRAAEGHYQFRVATKAPPFLVAMDAPGFMRSLETDYFDEEDLAEGRIEWEIPAAARLHLQLGPARSGDLPPYESSSVEVACQIPEEAKYITLWLQRYPGSTFEATLEDLPPGHYRAILRLIPPEAQKTTLRGYYDDVPFELAAGEKRTLRLTCVPFDPNGWRGSATLEAVVRTYGGSPATGQPFSLTYIVPHYDNVPVQKGTLDGEGRLRLANIRPGPNGPEFFLRIGPEWLRRIRVTEPGDQHFTFTLAPEVNDVVPDVALTDVMRNQPISLRSLQGHVLYLEFWATWCGPCKIPMIRLNDMMKKRSRDWDGRVDALAVSIDDDPGTVRRYAHWRGWTHVRHVWAGAEGQTDFDSPAGQAFGVNGVPMAFLIAADGRIVWRGHPRDANPERQIDELLQSTDQKSPKDP
jgi:thiol-disulfide isomerase/thioredoxin